MIGGIMPAAESALDVIEIKDLQEEITDRKETLENRRKTSAGIDCIS